MKKARPAVAALAVTVLALAAGVTAGSAHADLNSSNWSGYVAMGFGSTPTTASPGIKFTQVAGQWVQPSAICTKGSPTSVAVWVGLGGYSETSRELEQVGTEADCNASGTATYSVWYELVPASSVTVTSLKVFPGDVIASRVLVERTQVLVQVTDRTRNRRFTRHLTMASPDLSTAEWIVEAPARCGQSMSAYCSQSALTNFGTVDFTQARAVGNGMTGTITGSNWMTTALQLVPHGSRTFGSTSARSYSVGADATTSALSTDGRGFSVAWQPKTASG